MEKRDCDRLWLRHSVAYREAGGHCPPASISCQLCEIRTIQTTNSRHLHRLTLCRRMTRPMTPCYRILVLWMIRFRRSIPCQEPWPNRVFVRSLPELPRRLLSVRRFGQRALVSSCPTIHDLASLASWSRSNLRHFRIRLLFHPPLRHPFGLHSEMRHRRTRVFLRPSTWTRTPVVYS